MVSILSRFIGSTIACIVLATGAVAATPPYFLENTEVVATPSVRLKRSYEIYVSFPANYTKSAKRFPVVYVTDAPYAFPLIRSIAGRVDRHGAGLEDFILIGLSYANGEDGTVSRNRDYTPTARTRDGESHTGVYGQSAAYLDFLVKEVLPLVDGRYKTDPSRRIFVGHSYGSLLGIKAMLDHPKIFGHYILGSPSLWFDRGYPFEALDQYKKTHSDLVAKVRFYVGGNEKPTRSQPQETEMVAQMNRYVADLKAQRWRGLDVKATVFDGEDHATVFPRFVTHGLMWALPKRD